MSRKRTRRKAFREAFMAHGKVSAPIEPIPPPPSEYEIKDVVNGDVGQLVNIPVPPLHILPTAPTSPPPTTRPKPIYGQTIEQNVLGHHFRSKTEAQWAFFFEYLGLKWLYEPEGYELSRRYLPDFFLPTLRCWFEVKGPMPSAEEKDLCRELAKVTKYPVILNFGEPGWWLDNDGTYGGSFQFQPNGNAHICGLRPAICPGCKAFSFSDGKATHLCLEGGIPESDSTLVRMAARYAQRGVRWNG